MPRNFTKMHGLGNDFVLLHGGKAPEPAMIRRLADRHTGIGFDQLLWLDRPHTADTDVFYRVFNADGGEVEQCGNGARCVARYVAGDAEEVGRVWQLGYPGGVVQAKMQDDGDVAVMMAVPDFNPASLPFIPPGQAVNGKYTLNVAGEAVEFAIVSMGNPHAVMHVADVATAPVSRLGALLESQACFSNRANIGFMQIVDPAHIRLRVFERGVGETRACGTGACAAVAIGRRAGLLDTDVTVSLPGGELRVCWAGEGEPVWLTGEAVHAFEGVIAE